MLTSRKLSKMFCQELLKRVELTMKDINYKRKFTKFPNFKHLNDEEIFEELCWAIQSRQASADDIDRNREKIRHLLKNYKIEKVSKISNSEIPSIAKKIRSLGIRSRILEDNLKGIRDNAKKFIYIRGKFGSFKSFLEKNLGEKEKLIEKLIDPKSKYKMRAVSLALCCEFLKNIGIDEIKPDLHIIRMFSRLGFIKVNDLSNPTLKEKYEARRIGWEISRLTGKKAHEVDWILWEFCYDGGAEICTSNPRCGICRLSNEKPRICAGA